jgi:hypothetical protein
VRTSTSGVSVDQIAAQKIGHLTRLPSLELSTDGQRSAGRVRHRLLLRVSVQPGLEERDHADGSRDGSRAWSSSASLAIGAAGRAKALRQAPAVSVMQKSILDTVLAEAKTLQGKVNGK